MSEILRELKDEIERDAYSSGDTLQTCFFKHFAEIAAESGETKDLEHKQVFQDGNTGYQIDGWAFDDENDELYIGICDFRSEFLVETLNQDRLDSMFRRVERFIKKSMVNEFIKSLEESSPAWDPAIHIYENQTKISRIRVVLLTNSKLAIRKKNNR